MTGDSGAKVTLGADAAASVECDTGIYECVFAAVCRFFFFFFLSPGVCVL